MMRTIVLLAVLCPAMTAAQSPCSGQTQIDANFCAKERWQAADAELNRLWGAVKPRADARGTGQSLLRDQRAWLQSRDAACEGELTAGGSAAPMFYWACMEEQTLQRNQVLRSLP